MEKKELCSIIKDLLPSYVEKLTNEETNKFIDSHINDCPECKEMLENMRKEIEINAPKNEAKNLKYIKRYSKRLKLLRNILLIIALVFVVIIARRFVIITNLNNKVNKLQDETNYCIQLECYQNRKMIIYNKYVKNEKSLTVEKIYNVDNFINTVQYIDYESDVEELHLVNDSSLKNESLAKKRLSIDISNHTLILHTFFKKLLFSIITDIQNVELNGNKCYLIKMQNSENFIDADTGLILKFIDNNENIVTDYHYEFGTVTDEDVAKPDTTGYVSIDD